MFTRTCALLAVVALSASAAHAGVQSGLQKGDPDVKSAGALAFGPDGVLFIGDSTSAAVFAVDTGDKSGPSAKAPVNVEGIDQKVAALLGTTAREVQINDLAVNPASGNVYLSVSRGRGPEALPVVVRVDAGGKLSEVSLKDVPFAKAELPNAPAPGAASRGESKRSQSITDLLYVDGKVFIAGLSNEEFESTLRSIPFPFSKADKGTGVKIYHGAHGRFETQSPVRTFTHYKIDGQPFLLAGYTCTPLVKFPVSDLKPGVQLQGVTVAELGNRNRPLDMFVYSKGGKDYILMANSSRGMMKVTTENLAAAPGLTDKDGRVADTAGLSYETIEGMKGVVQLDKLDDQKAVIIVQEESGRQDLKTVELP
ncbi:MAG: hypothetical protein WD069_11945 [Planctomycetales bacterium]